MQVQAIRALSEEHRLTTTTRHLRVPAHAVMAQRSYSDDTLVALGRGRARAQPSSEQAGVFIPPSPGAGVRMGVCFEIITPTCLLSTQEKNVPRCTFQIMCLHAWSM